MTKPKALKALDAIANAVLRYRPKPKSLPAKNPYLAELPVQTKVALYWC